MDSKGNKIILFLIISVFLIIGILIGDIISHNKNETVELYSSATIIEDPEQLRNCMGKDLGMVMLYGEYYTNEPVTFPEIGGEYIEITRITEEREIHTSMLPMLGYNSKMYLFPETHSSWNRIDEETRRAKNETFLSETFDGGLINLPSERISLENIDKIERVGDYIYGPDGIRYYYVGIKNHVHGTILGEISNNTLIDPSEFYLNTRPEEIIAGQANDAKECLDVFWGLWGLLMFVITICCAGFLA